MSTIPSRPQEAGRRVFPSRAAYGLGLAISISAAALSISCATTGSSRASLDWLRRLERGEEIGGAYSVLGRSYETKIVGLSVPESRGEAAGASLTIPVMTWKARRPDGSPPLFILHGGPGLLNLKLGADSALAEKRDLVLVGYRGVDGTHRLRADAGYRAAASRFATSPTARNYAELRASLARMARSLALRGVGLDGYSIEEAADDLEAARLAAGYGPVDVYGESFGSRIAEAFAYRHPASVRRLVVFLSGAPLDYYGGPETFRESLMAAARRAGVEADEAIAAAARLASSPDGRITLAACQGALASRESGAAVARALASYSMGDSRALAGITRRFAADFSQPGREVMQRLLMLGSLPALRESRSDLLAESDEQVGSRPLFTLEADLARALREVGAGRDGGAGPFGEFAGPVLVLSGEYDPFDPPGRARESLLPLFPAGRMIVLGDIGHEYPEPPFGPLVDGFLSTGEVDAGALPPGAIIP